MAYQTNVLRGLAITQIVFGGIMFLLQIISTTFVQHWSSHVRFGVWVGVWAVITGVLGYLCARDESTPKKRLIGCYKGFSITTCVIASLMFICYWAALDEFATVIHCYENQAYDFNYSYRYYSPTVFYKCRIYGLNHSSASTGAALGGCLLVCALVETAISLTASIYYFGVMRCETTSPSASYEPLISSQFTTNEQAMFVQAGQAYSGAQTVVIQPGGAIATGPAPVSQPIFNTPQQFTASGMPPGGSVPLAYPATTMIVPGIAQHPGTAQTVPPPYTLTQAGNAAPSTVAIGDDAGNNPQDKVTL